MTTPSEPPTTPALWGHRGLGQTPYENTLVGFERALAAGASGIELDVRPCATGELVVTHDAQLTRVAGRPDLVADLGLRELADIRLSGSGEAIPLLSDAIDLVRGRGAELNVELKADVPDLAAAVTALSATLARHSRAEREGLIVSSFALAALADLHGRGVPRLALLIDAPMDADNVPPWMFAIHPHASLVQPSLSAWRARDLRVNTWTVNDGDTARYLAKLGVDAIITDDVPSLREALGHRPM